MQYLQKKELPAIKEVIPMIIPLLFTFYFMYPQAMSVLGSSFVLLSGTVGLAYYSYHRFPFRETANVILGMGVMLLWFYSVSWYNNSNDPYTLGYFKSEIALLFSAYMLILVIFNVHKKPTVETVLKYIVGAVALQCFFTFIMSLDESIADFFFSLQLQTEYSEEVVGENSWQRLMGYGIAFFGAGANNGVALVIISYLLVSKTLAKYEFFLLSALYVFIFYISLFMARTTVVGAGVGFVLIAYFYFIGNKGSRKQVHKFVITALFLMFGGYLFAMFYYQGLSDWAFELFINFMETGKLRTRSSDGLGQMFKIPETAEHLLFGDGRMVFRGTDVGFSRMFFYVGIIGSILFYGYAFFLIKMWGTKNRNVKILGVTIAIYSMILNFKGWFDLNHIFFLLFFYFMFYKYYVYYPKLANPVPLKQRKMAQTNTQQ